MKTEAEWRAEKEFKRDEAERKRAAAADSKEERRWRGAGQLQAATHDGAATDERYRNEGGRDPPQVKI
jgi:hypothetical protein